MEATKPAESGLGCSVLTWVSITSFILFMIVVLVPDVMDFMATRFHCPDAVEVLSDTRDGGNVRRGSSTTATTVTSLTCVFADGSEKVIGNDPRFLTGVGLALALGIGSGVLIAFALAILARFRKAQ